MNKFYLLKSHDGMLNGMTGGNMAKLLLDKYHQRLF